MRRSLVLALLLCVCCFTGTALGSTYTSAAGHIRFAIRPQTSWQTPSQTAARSQIVVLLPWQQALMHRLKAANPHLIVLEYKDLASTSSYAPIDGASPDGVTYAQAAEEHPNWLLRTRAGEPIQCRGYPYLWAMAIGNRGFQRAWTDEVVHELLSEGWSGVFMDNVDPTIRYYHDPSNVAQYPTDAAYAAATTSALAYIAPRIHAAGKLVMANIGSWPNYEHIGMRWLEYLDGAMDEHFAKY
ncbi:MAG TPA: putative glycoside hydrolase, partial [Steroidobacteraceae bacterium]|nr:putative glycoside hydrolase [Steroidobacteraceae bacterium]